jgi:hypothetical protein
MTVIENETGCSTVACVVNLGNNVLAFKVSSLLRIRGILSGFWLRCIHLFE